MAGREGRFLSGRQQQVRGCTGGFLEAVEPALSAAKGDAAVAAGKDGKAVIARRGSAAAIPQVTRASRGIASGPSDPRNDSGFPAHRLPLTRHHLTDRQLSPPSIFRYSDISSSATLWPNRRGSAAVWGKPAATSTVSLTRMQLAAYSSPSVPRLHPIRGATGARRVRATRSAAGRRAMRGRS